MSSGGVYSCLLQICSNVMQNSIFKEILFWNANCSSPNLEYFSQHVSYSSSGIAGICHAVKTESKRIVILGKDNLKYQGNVKMHPKKKSL